MKWAARTIGILVAVQFMEGRWILILKLSMSLRAKQNVYDKLLKSGIRNPHNLITQLFIEFENGNIGNNELTIKMATNIPNSNGGKTVLDKESGNIQIHFNAKITNQLSSIEVAAILVHEIAHAFLGKHYNNYNASFKELYSQYIHEKGLADYSHDIMRDKFIIRMPTALKIITFVTF